MGGKSGSSMVPILFIVTAVSLIDGLDGSIVNVALPTLAAEFNTDTGTIAWVTVVYLMMLAGLLVFFARIAKNGAIRRILIIGVLVFTFGSILCGASNSLEMLIASRLIQGAGAAMMGAAAPMICVRYLPENKLGVGMATLTLGCSIGFALGPVIGGILIDLLSWHWMFIINVPLGIIAVIMILRIIPKDTGYDHNSLDVKGAALLFTAITMGLIAMERMPYAGEALFIVVCGMICMASLALFIIWESKVDSPLLNPAAFKNWRFSFTFLSFILMNMAYMGLLYLMPFYMDVCMGFTPMESGFYLFLPPFITLILCIPISRRSDRTGRRLYCILGCLSITIGGSIMLAFATQSLVLPLLATLVCMGLAWAFCGGPMASNVVEQISEESREMGSSLANETIYLGGAIGTALFAMIFTVGAGTGNTDFNSLPLDVFEGGFVFSMAFCIIISLIPAVLSLLVRDVKRKGVS